MHKLIPLIILLLTCLSTQAQNDRDKLNLQGNVKAFSEAVYKASPDDKRGIEYGLPSPFHFNKKVRFNENGNIIEERRYINDQGSEARTYGYSDEGFDILFNYRIVSYTPAGKTDTAAWYDAKGNLLIRLTYKYNTDGIETMQQTYNAMSDDTTTISHKLDKRGFAEETTIRATGNSNQIKKYEYDNRGNKIKSHEGIIFFEDENGNPTWEAEYTETYLYNEKGLLIETNNTGEYGAPTYYTYDTTGRLLSEKANYSEDLGFSLISYVYDRRGNVIKITRDEAQDGFGQSSGLNQVSQRTFAYDYDESDNWTKCIEYINGKAAYITYRRLEYE